jgi:hypothetical protein
MVAPRFASGASSTAHAYQCGGFDGTPTAYCYEPASLQGRTGGSILDDEVIVGAAGSAPVDRGEASSDAAGSGSIGNEVAISVGTAGSSGEVFGAATIVGTAGSTGRLCGSATIVGTAGSSGRSGSTLFSETTVSTAGVGFG